MEQAIAYKVQATEAGSMEQAIAYKVQAYSLTTAQIT
jgi:hypothetical protein